MFERLTAVLRSLVKLTSGAHRSSFALIFASRSARLDTFPAYWKPMRVKYQVIPCANPSGVAIILIHNLRTQSYVGIRGLAEPWISWFLVVPSPEEHLIHSYKVIGRGRLCIAEIVYKVVVGVIVGAVLKLSLIRDASHQLSRFPPAFSSFCRSWRRKRASTLIKVDVTYEENPRVRSFFFQFIPSGALTLYHSARIYHPYPPRNNLEKGLVCR